MPEIRNISEIEFEDEKEPEDHVEEEEVFLNQEVCELTLTRSQVRSLKWVMKCWLKQYLENEGSRIKTDVSGVAEALEEIK